MCICALLVCLWTSFLLNIIVGCSLDIVFNDLVFSASCTYYKQNRGAYLEDCRLFQPTIADGVDADSSIRYALWAVTEEQVAAAVEKANL